MRDERRVATCLPGLVTLMLLAGCGDRDTPAEQTMKRPAVQSDNATADARVNPEADLTSRARAAATVVRDFYAALERQDYATAWSRLSPSLREQFGGLATWRAGFATTRSTKVDVNTTRATDENHASVAIDLRSVDREACDETVRQRFAGTWRLTRVVGRWRATSVDLRKTAGGSVRTGTADCPNAGHADRASRDGEREDTEDTEDAGGRNGKVCYPETRLPSVHLDAVKLPAVRLPAVSVGDRRIPARTIPARTIPARTIPARTIPGRCFDVPRAFELSRTTVRVSNYDGLDANFSPSLSEDLWESAPSVSTPDYTAQGFGELNGAGFPKNQYVRPYVRRDGTRVSGYWRNSPSDGLPTCRVISC